MTTTRRVFLRALGATGVAVTCARITTGCAGGPLPGGGPQTAASIPQGLSFATDGSPVIFGRDAGGLYAMSSICTHAGCDMTQQGAVSGSEVQCFCHGSTFDANGNPLGGPAFSQLPHLSVSVAANGTVNVDENTVVPSTTRAAITGAKSG